MDTKTEQNGPKTNLSIPGAIILAGIIIAGGIYLSKLKPAPATGSATASSGQNITINPVSPTEHILGNPNAPIVIVEFSDTECPYCKEFEGTMESIMNTYAASGTVAWVYRDFPLDIHPRSEKEAEALECATTLGGNTTFWKYEEAIYATTTSNNTLDPSALPIIAQEVGLNVDAFNTCLASGKEASVVQAYSNDALAAGAQGTPYSVMLLKTPLDSNAYNTITQYITAEGLASNVTISANKQQIVLSGALPLQMVTTIINAIIKG